MNGLQRFGNPLGKPESHGTDCRPKAGACNTNDADGKLGDNVGDELHIKIYYGYTTYQIRTLPALRAETVETTMKCGPLGAPAPAARNPARQ